MVEFSEINFLSLFFIDTFLSRITERKIEIYRKLCSFSIFIYVNFVLFIHNGGDGEGMEE